MNMNEQTQEILLILSEECSEVTQAISKCFRFGMEGLYQDRTNRDRLEQEIGDVLAMIALLERHGTVSSERLQVAKQLKFKKLSEWSTINLSGIE